MADEGLNLIELTADIVSSHVTKNSVAVADLPRLIQQVHQALASLGQAPEEVAEETKGPAVSVRASIKPDHLVCLQCGRKQKTLRRHLENAHGMTPQAYREAFGLKSDYPMVAPEYSQRRRQLAQDHGLGRRSSPAEGHGEGAPAGVGAEST